MATTTPNFGWVVPTSTDLVKNGATAIETLGDSIDASFVGLKGGTTGQVLSKTSGTDLAFTWITSSADITGVTAGTGISGGGTSGDVTITNSMATAIDAKGDLIAGTGADAFSRLAIGSNNQVLTADSTAATGMKWAAIASPAFAYTQLATGSLSSGTVTVSGLSGYNEIYVKIDNLALNDSAYSSIVRFNSDTGSNYWRSAQVFKSGSTTYSAGGSGGTDTSIPLGQWGNTGGAYQNAVIKINAANSTGIKTYAVRSSQNGANGMEFYDNIQGIYSGTSVISSVSLIASSTSFSSGTYTIYGAN